MSPEFLEALKLVEEYDRLRTVHTVEYRLYYDTAGLITAYSETDHPEGNYIVIDHPDVFHKNNTQLLRVVDGELKILDAQPKLQLGVQRSTTGQRVVQGMAALALINTEEYAHVEYYDRKTNN